MTSVLTLFAFWFSSNFCSDFYFSLSKRTEIFLHNWGSSIWLTLLWECSLEFLSITIVFSANWGECLIWRFHLNYFLILTTIFFPICFSLSYEDLDSQSLCWLKGLSMQSVQEIFRFGFKKIFFSCLFASLLGGHA